MEEKIVKKKKPTVAVHKFTSCDGCQLAFLNMGSDLLTLSKLAEIIHFAEAGPIDLDANVDIAFIEGSISTAEEMQRIKKIRANSKYLITIGACATAGGLQALRNFVNAKNWIASLYATPEYIDSLEKSTPISQHVKVDYELWGCPVNSWQIITTLRSLLFGVTPAQKNDPVCLECKRRGNVCVLVAKGEPCLGPVTQTGCGALCPEANRECYGCYGPSENPNTESLSRWFTGLGYSPEAIAKQFLQINNQAPSFLEAGRKLKKL